MLGNPLLLVGNPFLLNDRLPLVLVRQRVICLPGLKRLRLRFDLQDALARSYIPAIIMEPTTDALHRVKSACYLGVISNQVPCHICHVCPLLHVQLNPLQQFLLAKPKAQASFHGIP